MDKGPRRTCAGCRGKRPQGELIRVVRRRDGAVSVEPSRSRGRGAGRGAYVCPERSCAERALVSSALRRALRLDQALPEEVVEELRRRVGGAS